MEKKLIESKSLCGIKYVIFMICLLIATIVFIGIRTSRHDYYNKWNNVYRTCQDDADSINALNRYLGKYEYYDGKCFEKADHLYPNKMSGPEKRLLDYVTNTLFVISSLSIIIYILFGRNIIIVTDKKVSGKSILFKRVDLPLDSVSSVSTGIFWKIKVGTSSGSIRFLFMKNRNKVFEVINELILKRQSKEENTKEDNKKIDNDALEEIKKYKELLDSNIITKEDYEKKKKELLNL